MGPGSLWLRRVHRRFASQTPVRPLLREEQFARPRSARACGDRERRLVPRRPMTMTALRSPARTLLALVASVFLAAFLSACSSMGSLPPAPRSAQTADQLYKVGPLDSLNIVVWRNPDLSGVVAVRPDGRISSPLVQDLLAAGKTPAEIAREIESTLSKYVRDPSVTVLVTSFQGTFS